MPWWNPIRKTREQSAPRRPGSEDLERRLLREQRERFALTHSHFQLVPFEGGRWPEDQAANERLRQDFAQRLAQATGQTVSQVLADCEANRRLTALEARSYGLVDEIVERAT